MSREAEAESAAAPAAPPPPRGRPARLRRAGRLRRCLGQQRLRGDADPLQRSARADVREPGRRVREEDRDQGRVRSDDEDVLADQIATEGAHSPADLFYTENSPPLMSLQEKGLLSPVAAARWRTRRASTTRRSGDWVGVRPGPASSSTTRP